MSSGSVMGRCKITVPAAEKMTTRMMRTTPVLMELSVCQIFRDAERSDGAISFSLFLACCNARSAPTRERTAKSFVGRELALSRLDLCKLYLSHNTHLEKLRLRIHPLR